MHDYLYKFAKNVLQYKFKNIDLLIEAVTHPSVKSENFKQKTYERLEFFGDSVLSFILSDLLLKNFPNDSEGELSKRLMNMVCREKLYQVAQELQVGQIMIMTKGEEKNGGRENINSMADVIEALTAALFLDGGISEVKKFVEKFWHEQLKTKEINDNAKTILQELLQAKKNPLPIYELIEEKGLDHKPKFYVRVKIEKIGEFFGDGLSKKEAEIQAAKKALEFLKKI